MIKVGAWLLVFWGMQVAAQLLFKWGSIADGRWWTGFIGGNLFGFSSIWLLMLVYKAINPHLALALATAGAFVFGQIGLGIAFGQPLTTRLFLGSGLIVLGVVIIALEDLRFA